ncbi:hypothetical protein Rsub_13394, partial [Raphidocelis subcapitata]
MWRFLSASPSAPAGAEALFSLNSFQGRQTWEFDPAAGSEEERARVEELRAAFAANKHAQKHSADELLRLQCAPKIAAARAAPPAEPLPEGEPVTAERGGAAFYESLQCDDGHFPGDYGGPMFLMPGLVVALHTMGRLEE